MCVNVGLIELTLLGCIGIVEPLLVLQIVEQPRRERNVSVPLEAIELPVAGRHHNSLARSIMETNET